MPAALKGHPLNLQQLLPVLVRQGLIPADTAQRLSSDCSTRHPLECIAAEGHCLEALTQWLARHAGQPYLRIDPLKIDVATVVPLMSHAFAQRHAILAVAVDTKTVTVASAQPYVTAWEAGLAQVLKRSIRRVVANPQDIRRCIDEFYRLAKSVSGAEQMGATPLNPTCSTSEPPTTRRMPMTLTSSLLSIGCCSTPSNNGPAISISNRVATRAA